MDPQPLDPSSNSSSDSIWKSAHESAANTVETLNRFLGTMVRDGWDDLDRALRITESFPDFSGILPLGDPLGSYYAPG